jgi:meiotically up-regulated gene 157 (Mug157) protein
MNRRKFITQTGFVSTALLASPALGNVLQPANSFISKRPPLAQRKFTSKAVEDIISKTKTLIKDPELAWMFENCFPNTLDTTVEFVLENGKPDTFVITGDIHAMWLRDSTAQVWPYLPYVTMDQELFQLILGVIHRQTACISIDPFANAFNKGATGSEWASDHTNMKPELHERKWEIDSLCYPVRLSYHFWKLTGNSSFATTAWEKSMHSILNTFKEQQRKTGRGSYSFARTTPKATDTLSGGGFGNPTRPVGLICSSFRPSDDATILPFLIPSNYFAVTTLRQLAEMFTQIKNDTGFAKECESLAMEVESALRLYASANHQNYGEVLAFEVDGFGNQLFMDDANVPSLLALPYLGCLDKSNVLYQNTRKFILSTDNPWFFRGKAGEGIGGPHVGAEMIWPMSIIMRAMTSSSVNEIKECLRILKNTHAGTGFMHETFHKDDPARYSRSWFAWANTLFGELIIKISKEHPEILKESF